MKLQPGFDKQPPLGLLAAICKHSFNDRRPLPSYFLPADSDRFARERVLDFGGLMAGATFEDHQSYAHPKFGQPGRTKLDDDQIPDIATLRSIAAVSYAVMFAFYSMR